MTLKPLPGKLCTGCHRRLPESEFDKRAASADGLQYRCRPCRQDKTTTDPPKNQLPGEKLCTGCNQWLTESEFYKRNASADGLQPFCKTCSQTGTPAKQVQHKLVLDLFEEHACELVTTGLFTHGNLSDEEFLALFKICPDCSKTLPLTRFDQNSTRCEICLKKAREVAPGATNSRPTDP